MKITKGSGTTYTSSPAFSPSAAGDAWRTNILGGNWYVWGRKNTVEFKSGVRVPYEQNIHQNGWSAGQGNATVLTSREWAHSSDYEVRWNKWINCVVPVMLLVGDPEQGYGYGPSGYPNSRIWIHNNLMVNSNSPAMLSPAGGNDPGMALQLTAHSSAYGLMVVGGPNIRAGATTGRNITFTSDSGAFHPTQVGLELRLTSTAQGTGVQGKGTIVSVSAAP